MTFGQGLDTPLGHGHQLCEILSRSDRRVRSYGPDTMWTDVRKDRWTDRMIPCWAGSTVPREGFDSPFPGVLWLWHFLYSVGPHPVSSLHIYTFVVSRAFMAGAASQAGDADSSRAPGLTSGLQGSVNVHHGALLLVPQWQSISSFVFYNNYTPQEGV